MATTEYDTIRAAYPDPCAEIEYFTRCKIKAEAEGRDPAMYDAYLLGFCDALQKTKQIGNAHTWAHECERRLRKEVTNNA